ncbi:hypothetical protein MTsPCn9_10050 [Croceitalea sp. MTPC9]|uniref:DUF4386 domain-containing protein n=1 Tax=Croceitalea marina TaxID=1775166 RepID=A0ABW5MZD0_9FLAO|nr:hypothetical protein MTsPCn5_37750 [Croceitalea sp. MTPC5]GMN11388.1 hypothetical protein MTsPCn6_27190 [Croceitalea sp. MTPC6]GMN16069.1 hypothetical protein MTsPCn9_10050 [Croceitalea sp. MTPC9]
MKSQFYKITGISLSAGSFLAIITMILHPSGGSFQEIINQAAKMQIAHSIAIACIPFMLFGFYGLTDRLLGLRKISKLALISVTLGLFSAMLAALFNGLILPNFLNQHAKSLEQSESFLKILVSYGFTINKALDYVFIVALIFGILIYSILIIKTQKISKYLGYFGLLILIFSIIGGLTGFAFTSLIGFRIFVFSVAVWILCSGISLIQSNKA